MDNTLEIETIDYIPMDRKPSLTEEARLSIPGRNILEIRHDSRILRNSYRTIKNKLSNTSYRTASVAGSAFTTSILYAISPSIYSFCLNIAATFLTTLNTRQKS
jgi:hypothetical protein